MHARVDRVHEGVSDDRIARERRVLPVTRYRTRCRLINDLIVFHGDQHLQVCKRPRIDSRWVGRKDHKIGNLAGLNRAFVTLFKILPGRPDRHQSRLARFR